MRLIFFCLIISIIPTYFLKAQEIQVIGVEELEKLVQKPSNGIRVVNFWATWCKPCIEELPYFEKIHQNQAFDKVDVFLVSMDFIEDKDTKVKKFVEKKDIRSNVLLMNNTDYNSWIDLIEPSWSGAIPATMFINGETGERKFYEKQFKPGELEEELIGFINNP